MELDQFQFLLDSIHPNLLLPALDQDKMAASQGLQPPRPGLQFPHQIPTLQEPPSATERITVGWVGTDRAGWVQVLVVFFQSPRGQFAHFPCQNSGARLPTLNLIHRFGSKLKQKVCVRKYLHLK